VPGAASSGRKVRENLSLLEEKVCLPVKKGKSSIHLVGKRRVKRIKGVSTLSKYTQKDRLRGKRGGRRYRLFCVVRCPATIRGKECCEFGRGGKKKKKKALFQTAPRNKRGTGKKETHSIKELNREGVLFHLLRGGSPGKKKECTSVNGGGKRARL